MQPLAILRRKLLQPVMIGGKPFKDIERNKRAIGKRRYFRHERFGALQLTLSLSRADQILHGLKTLTQFRARFHIQFRKRKYHFLTIKEFENGQ